MTLRIQSGGLRVAKVLYDFIDEALPGTGIEAVAFWPALESIVLVMAPRNRALLA
jgi:malate synthase